MLWRCHVPNQKMNQEKWWNNLIRPPLFMPYSFGWRTLIFLLQYFELVALDGSFISSLRSAAPDKRRKLDVIFWASDGRRLFKSFLHSLIIVLESNSVGLCNVSSSFSTCGRNREIKNECDCECIASLKIDCLRWLNAPSFYQQINGHQCHSVFIEKLLAIHIPPVDMLWPSVFHCENCN